MRKLSAISYPLSAERGAVLLMTFIMMTTLTAITVAFLCMSSTQLKGSGYGVASSKALWLAEAGLQKAVWYLKTPVGSGGQGENWTTSGTTGTLGNGSYTMVVERWNFALDSHGASASASSEQGGHKAEKAIDGNNATYWESDRFPSIFQPEYITVAFPYTLTINKVRFLSHFSLYRPRDYSWQVSTDGTNYTTIVSITGNTQTDRTDEFQAVANVNYLRLRVTMTGGLITHVAISTLEAIGSKITSTGTVSVMNRKIAQTVVADDAMQTAADEIDWNEIVPAT